MERRNGEDAEPVERVLGALRNVRQTLRHNNIELDLQTLRQRRQVELVAATSVLVDAGHRGRPGGSQRIVVTIASRRRGRRRFRQTSFQKGFLQVAQRIAARSPSLAHHLARLLTSWARRSSSGCSSVAVAAQLLAMALLLFAGRVASGRLLLLLQTTRREAVGIRTGDRDGACWTGPDSAAILLRRNKIPGKSQCQIGRNPQADCGFGQCVFRLICCPFRLVLSYLVCSCPFVLSYGVESFTCSVQHLKRNFLSFSLFLFYGRRRGDGTKRIIKEQQAKGNLELAFSSSLFLQSALHTGGTISKIQAINIIGRMPLLSTAGKLLLLFFDCMLDCSVDAIIHFFFFFFVVRNPTGGEKSKKAWKFGRSCGITLSTGKAVEGSLVISLRWNYQRLARSCIVLLVFSFPPTSPALQQQQQPISFLFPPYNCS